MPESRGIRVGSWALPGLVAVIEGARLIYISRLPDSKLIQYIPDDAFYYLAMGKNFARMGRWTFDGVEPASGFHLLWGYLIASIYYLAPAIGLHAIFVAAGVVQIACLTLTVWLVSRTASRLFGAGAQAGVALIFLSSLLLVIGIGMMETAVELLVAAALVDLLCRTGEDLPRFGLAVALVLGFLGTLARSDFGLVPFGLFAMQWMLWRRGVSTAAMLRAAGAALGGAAAGVIAIALHTHWISGGWIQASARQKFFWSHTGGLSIAPARRLVFRFLNVVENASEFSAQMEHWAHATSVTMWIVMAIGLLLALWQRSAGSRAGREGKIVLAAMLFVVLAYIGLYRVDTEMQDWYGESFAVPLALLAAGAISWFAQRQRRLTLGVVAAMCVVQIGFSFETPWPWQDVLYLGGIYLHDHPGVKPVGSWNAGILGYLAEGGVTNIDGLVNDRILPYTKAGTLASYIAGRPLRSVMDYNTMLLDHYAKRGGYADGLLKRCLVEDDVLKGKPGVPPSNEIRLYHVTPECGQVH